MQQPIVWSQLGRIALKFPKLRIYYTRLGQRIVDIPRWKQIIYNDLYSWIEVFASYGWGKADSLAAEFMSLIRKVWIPPSAVNPKQCFADDIEECWALAILALSNVWEKYEITGSLDVREIVLLVRCTISTVFLTTYYTPSAKQKSSLERVFEAKKLSFETRRIFCLRLATSLRDAAGQVNAADSSRTQHLPTQTEAKNVQFSTEAVGTFLQTLGQELASEFQSTSNGDRVGTPRKEEDWKELENRFLADLNDLEERLNSHTAIPE
jgi:hypothetical protein